MIQLLRPLVSLLLSATLLMTGSGLLSILIAVRGGAEGFSVQTIGLITSGYFVGFFLGTFLAPGLIKRIGHVRAFSFYTVVAAISVLLYPNWVSPAAWFLLRCASGLALVGLCTVIESWLNSQTPAQFRGRIFSIYMIVSLLALASGQLLLDSQPAGSFFLFSLIAIFISLAALPVTTTRLAQPCMPNYSAPNIWTICRTAPTAAAGAVLSGVTIASFLGLGPVFASDIGLNRGEVAAFMAIAISGGTLMQFPIGRLSDLGDRRTTLSIIGVIAGIASITAYLLLPMPVMMSNILFFIIGAFAFSIYPLCVAHLLDRLSADALLAGCSALLLLNGIGAALGPTLAGFVMGRFGPQAFPIFLALAFAALALLAGSRRLIRAHLLLRTVRFYPMLRTTPAALELIKEIPDREQQGNFR